MNGVPAWLNGWLDWIGQNPGLALLVLALAAGIEGLLLVGLVIPGSVLMFAAGVLAANGLLDPWAVIISAALGAAAGDICSYAIGRRWAGGLPRLTGRWQLLPHAEQFFARRGALGIVLGRLIGPLRPFVPAVAGAAGYPWRRYVPMALIAGLIWAVAYALPGMLLGATFQLLAEVLGRLALLLAVLLGLGYLVWRLFATLLSLGQVYAEPTLLRIIDWSHRHRRLGRLGPALADRDQPETPVLLAVLLLLLLLALLLEGLLRITSVGPMPAGWNLTLLDQLASLRSPLLERAAHNLLRLTDTAMICALTVGLGLTFLLQNRVREAAHLLAGLLGGAALFAGLGAVALAAPAQLSGYAPDAVSLVEVGSAAGLAFLLAGLYATRRRRRMRLWLYWVLATVAALVAGALLLRGDVLPDRGMLVLALAGAWASLVTLGYRRHLARRAPPVPLWPHIVIGLLCLVFVPVDRPAPAPPPPQLLLDERPDRLNLIWVGPVAPALQARGWQRLPPWSPADIRPWLAETALERLPPAPVMLNGEPPAQVWRRGYEILRLWEPPLKTESGLRLGHYGRLRRMTLLGLLRLPATALADWEQLPEGHGLAGLARRETPQSHVRLINGSDAAAAGG